LGRQIFTPARLYDRRRSKVKSYAIISSQLASLALLLEQVPDPLLELPLETVPVDVTEQIWVATDLTN
jgi:hypothetical protein